MPISHFGLAARDLVAAKAYYEDLLAIIGFNPSVGMERTCELILRN